MTKVGYVKPDIASLGPALLLASCVWLAWGTHVAAQTMNERVQRGELFYNFDAPNQDAARQTYTANLRDCRKLVTDNPDLRVRWTLRRDPLPGAEYAIKVRRDAQACNLSSVAAETEDACTLLRSRRNFSGRTVDDVFPARVVLGFSDPALCDDVSSNVDLSFIFSREQRAGETETGEAYEVDQVRLRVIGTRPSAPGEVSVLGGERSIEVRWTGPDSDGDYVVYYGTEPFDIATAPEEITGTRTRQVTGTRALVTSGIVVDQTYYVAVTTKDDSGNESLFSEQVEVVTRPVQNFWRAYRESGGQEEGGYCASAPASLGVSWLALLLLGLLWRGRQSQAPGVARRRGARGAAALFLVGGLLVYGGADAHAQSVARSAPRTVASPLDSAFEFKMGPWRPAIDSGEALGFPGPYRRLFGGGAPWLLELEYNRQLYRGIGSAGVGVNVGYWGTRARSLTEDGERGADRTRFDVVPLRIAGVYRFDWLAHQVSVPIVPTLKLGLDYYLWWVGDGRGVAAVEEGGDRFRGQGGTAGMHAAFGLHLLLDWFAPGMARTFDVNTGVNHSYLFVEYLMTKVDDFGSESSWDLSHSGFFFGIAFEF